MLRGTHLLQLLKHFGVLMTRLPKFDPLPKALCVAHDCDQNGYQWQGEEVADTEQLLPR
eukprot:CAMPEP_0178385836 /NCGR_PEP_ID=MMETSP0689_2-20121128/8236_1 /TAXON_ID=160604 /ORGANISM="Amphidinium massartii, Strain CS-259" /LENGTH=58 /DNA_ID=CAMNT_0020006127 /DNA_START=477 /DNA_END=650 /DNA_ORIENTATION=-